MTKFKTVEIVGYRAGIPILIGLILKHTLFSKTYLALLCVKLDVGMLITNGTQRPDMKTRGTDCATRSAPSTMAQPLDRGEASLPRGMVSL